MALSNALFSSVSGLDTTSTAISVIGDNIANVNTTGFKERRAEFSDVLGQTITASGGRSTLGAGSSLTGVSTNFTQGTFETTGRTTDLGIEGRGFFMLEGVQGTAYTRAGIFTIDNQGVLVSPEGLRVQGFGIDPATGSSNGQSGDIAVSTALAPPRPTGLVPMSLNLDSSATEVATGFDPTNPLGSSSYQTGVTLYDSLGNSHFSTLYFTRTGSGTWDWNATLPASETTTAPVPGANIVVQGGGNLSFDSTGALQTASGTTATFEFTGGATGSQAIDLDFGPIGGVGSGSPTTSFASESTTNSFSQDGFASGSLQSISIDGDGVLSGQFSNGEILPLSQLALATFPNVEGLQNIGGSNLLETRGSGQALIGAPGSGTFGSVRSGVLEQSTVDLAAQFVKLIVNQRAFQANTRTVSVTNELLANLVSLGQ